MSHIAADVRVSLEKEVRIQGSTYMVRKLGLSQVLKLAHLANSLQESIKDKLLAAQGTADMLDVMETLAEREFVQPIEILLNVRGLEHREALSRINLEELTDLIIAFNEVNDIQNLTSNFRKIASQVKGLLGTSGTPSAK